MSGGRITYADALNSLHQMVPDTRMAVIESILAQNGANRLQRDVMLRNCEAAFKNRASALL